MTEENSVDTDVPLHGETRKSMLGVSIDYELLGQCLEDHDGTEDEKRELIDAICQIMITFVDLGFGIEPTQQALQAGNKGRTSAALPFLDVILDSDIAGEFNSKNKTENDKEIMTEGTDK